MTQFQELRQEYNNRKNIYNRPDKEQLIFKAYDRFRRGIEVRFGDLQESKNIFLNDILIKIPQIELVKAKVNTLLTEIKSSNGMGIQVIYGEYGQGKSQIAQILEETYSNYNQHPNMLYYYHKLTTFENFMKNFSGIIRERFEKSPGLINIEKNIEKIENSLRKNNLPTNKIIDTFIEVIKESTRQGRPLLMILDEIDTILTTPEEFKPWGDLFVRLNDSEDLMMILMFLMPKAIGDKIKNIDNRLQRFNLWMGVKSVTLSGSYQNLITPAIANILSMKSISSKINFSDFYLEFASEALDFQYERLTKDSIRSVNIWAVELAELLQELMTFNWDMKHSQFIRESNIDQGNILEEKMRKFLLDCQIPDIKIINPDTENFDTYQTFFYNKNLNYLDKISDGHFLIKKIEDKIVVEEYPIALEIKYTSTEEHDSNQLLKLKKLAMGYPLIFFSLGSSEDYHQFLIKTIEQWYSESNLLYPILALRLPKNLLSPLLILSNREDPQYITCVNLLIAWACRFCPFVYHIENFISRLPEKLYKRQIALKIESLKVTGKNDDKLSSFQYSINTLCSIINTITKHKLIHVLEKEFKIEFKKKFPQLIEDSTDIFNQLIKELISINMIEPFDYGKNKTPAIKKVNLNWNITESVQKLSNKFV